MKLLLILIACLMPLTATPKELEFNYNEVYELVGRLAPKLPYSSTKAVSEAIAQCAMISGLSRKLLISLAYVESRLNPSATSKGDKGLFQINFINIKQYKLTKAKLYDPYYNTKVACKIIQDIRKKKEDDWIGYYNVGLYSKNKAKKSAYEYKVHKVLSLL